MTRGKDFTMDINLLDTNLAEPGQRLLQGVVEHASLPTERARDLADRLHGNLEQVQGLEKQLGKGAKKLERQLEKHAKRLPMETPLDKRRRRRNRRRGAARGAGTIVGAVIVAAAAYLIWRRRVRPSAPTHLHGVDTAGVGATPVDRNGQRDGEPVADRV
jgi:hypothetical protein